MKYPAATLALLFGLACHAGTIEGRVVSVADGDTITVLDADHVQHKIRLSGIDAPEKAQAFGNRSKESLSDLVFSKAVTVETEKKTVTGVMLAKCLSMVWTQTLSKCNEVLRGTIKPMSANSQPTTKGCITWLKTKLKLLSGACGGMLNRYPRGSSGKQNVINEAHLMRIFCF